jgi:hypothetical protein
MIMAELSVPCTLAIGEFHRARKNTQRFWNLLYALSSATVVTLIVGLISVSVGAAGAAVASGASAIMTGGGSLVLRRLKDNAVEELRRAQVAVREDCSGSQAGARGEGAVSLEEGAVSPAVLVALTEIDS